MQNLHNIDKSAFRKGEYVGYGGGHVWHIRKSNSSFGNWRARRQDNLGEWLYAFRLADMSQKLAALKTGDALPNPFAGVSPWTK